MKRTLLAAVALALLAGPATAEAGGWQPHVNGKALSCMAFAATPIDATLCYVGAPRFAGAKPMVFAGPQILAGIYSNPGSGIGQTWESNGIILDSATAPASTNAYVNYDGTNLVGNVPTGKGFAFAVNGSNAVTADSSKLALLQTNPFIQFNGSNNQVIQYFSTGRSEIDTNVADGASAVALTFKNNTTLSTVGAKLLDIQNNSVDKGYVSYAGGMTLSSSLTIVSSGGISGGTANAVITQAGGANLAGAIAFTGTAASPASGLSQTSATALALAAPSGGNDQLVVNGVGATLQAIGISANSTGILGQVNVDHLAGGSGAPTSPTAGAGCGTSSAATNAGSDLAGTIGVTCGSAGTANNHMITVTFAHAYNTAPVCTISADNAGTASIVVSARTIPVTSTTQLSVDCGNGGTCPGAGVAYLWTYTCQQ